MGNRKGTERVSNVIVKTDYLLLLNESGICPMLLDKAKGSQAPSVEARKRANASPHHLGPQWHQESTSESVWGRQCGDGSRIQQTFSLLPNLTS